MIDVKKMSLEEKCALLTGAKAFETRGYKRYGIPPMLMADGPHGLRKQADGANHMGIGKSVPATCFPTAVTIANSWDTGLAKRIGEALAVEALSQEVGVILGPGLNIKRSPLCGRNFEYFSEDPFLAGKMAAGLIRGIQSKGVSACPKHFAANSQELKRMSSDSVVDERTLREIYLTGFEIAVREAKPMCLMTSYNMLNGVFTNENTHLLKDILRGEWGYDGMIVSDWGGSNDHVRGVKATSTLEMPFNGFDSTRELVRAVRSGKISGKVIDSRVRELLCVVGKTSAAIRRSGRSFDKRKHHLLAAEAAARSMVLLKNEGDILPISPGKTEGSENGQRVAVIGDMAKVPRYQGAGSSLVNATRVDDALSYLGKSGLNITGYAKGYRRNGKKDGTLSKEALELAKNADIVLFFMGLDESRECEGADRADMWVNDDQVALLRGIYQVNKNIVIVLYGGSAMEAPWIKYAKAVVYAALPGQAGGKAVADIITGKTNPGGKLTETWPLRLEDTPAFNYHPGRKRNAEYREGLYVGYRYYDTAGVKTAFPFGYGLSYTAFEYKDIRVTDEGVCFRITNTGERDGEEVAQLYTGYRGELAGVYRVKKELKGFKRVFLNAGETKEVFIPFDEYTFRRFDACAGSFVKDAGDYEIMVGANSADIRLSKVYTISASATDKEPAAGSGDATPKCYYSGNIKDVSDEDFAALLGHPIPEDRVGIDRDLTLGELSISGTLAARLISGILESRIREQEKKGKLDTDLHFVRNMSLRATSKLTNGAVSMGMADALVMIFKGRGIIGTPLFILECAKNLVMNRVMGMRLH